MLPPDKLLEISTEKILDNQNPVKLCPYTRLNTNQGYSFISLKRRKAKQILASIELDVSWEHDESVGYLKEVNSKVYTQEKIKGDYCILYQDAVIFLSEFGGYTESMGQYLYMGKAVRLDKLPLIDSNLHKESYGYSCVELLMMLEGYNVIPEFMSLDLDKLTEGIFLIKVNDSNNLTMIRRSDDILEQVRVDSINIKGINVSRKNLMRFVNDLVNLGRDYDLFGLVGDYQIIEMNNYDNFSNLRGIRYEIILNFCYNIHTLLDCREKHITTVMFKMKE